MLVSRKFCPLKPLMRLEFMTSHLAKEHSIVSHLFSVFNDSLKHFSQLFTSETFNTVIVAANIQKNNSLSLENHVFGFPRLEIEIFVNFTTTTRNPFWLKFFSCKVQIPPAGGRRTTTSS